jgi:ribonuclease P protein component
VANRPPDPGAVPGPKTHVPALDPAQVPGVGVLRGAERFAALLSGRPVSRTEHFVAYHRSIGKLSTGVDGPLDPPVDGAPAGLGLVVGFVIPKRHAKRAVTRVAIRRQMRSAVVRHSAGLAAGEWALRLRVPWDPKRFRSATSTALVEAVHAELEALLLGAVARQAR